MDAILQFTVTNQEIERTDNFVVVEGSDNYLQAHFAFATPDWDGMVKTGVFIDEDGSAHPSLCNDDTCDVPTAWLKKQVGYVGVIGSDGVTKITTSASKVRISAKGYTGEDIEEETQTYFDQLLAAFAEKYYETEAQARLAQRWAVGLEDESETQEDNAAYYAGRAHSDALKATLERTAVVELAEHVDAVGRQVDEDKQATGQYKEDSARSAAKAALSESNAKASETAAKESQEAAESAETQAGLYAGQTKEDRNAVEQEKSDVAEIGHDVTDKKTLIDQKVDNFELLHQQAVADVNNAGQTQTERVEEAGNQSVNDVNAAGSTQVNNVNYAGQKALDNIGTGIDSSLKVEGKAADAAATGKAIDELKGDLGELKYTYENLILKYGTDVGYYNDSGVLVSDSRGLSSKKIPCKTGDVFVVTSQIISMAVIHCFDTENNFLNYELKNTSVSNYEYVCRHDGFITFTSFVTNGNQYLLSVKSRKIFSVSEELDKGIRNVIRERKYLMLTNGQLNNISGGCIYKINTIFNKSTLCDVSVKTSVTPIENLYFYIILYSDDNTVIDIVKLNAYYSDEYIKAVCNIDIPDNTYIGVFTNSGIKVVSTTDNIIMMNPAKIGNIATVNREVSNYRMCCELTFLCPTKIENELTNIEKPLRSKKWAVVGDSITENNFRTTMHYFDYISDITGISVVNYGRGGTGFANGKDNNLSYYQRVADLTDDNVDLVTIFGSPNDCMGGFAIGSKEDTLSDNTIAGYINETLRVLRTVQPYCKIAFITPFPYYGHTVGDTNDYMEKYATIIKEVASKWGCPVLDLYHNSCLNANDPLHIEKFYSDTGVHPNEEGHKYVTPLIKDFVMKLIL